MAFFLTGAVQGDDAEQKHNRGSLKIFLGSRLWDALIGC